MIRLDVAVAAAAVCVSNREEIFFSPPLSISITLLCAQKRLLLRVVVVRNRYNFFTVFVCLLKKRKEGGRE